MTSLVVKKGELPPTHKQCGKSKYQNNHLPDELLLISNFDYRQHINPKGEFTGDIEYYSSCKKCRIQEIEVDRKRYNYPMNDPSKHKKHKNKYISEVIEQDGNIYQRCTNQSCKKLLLQEDNFRKKKHAEGYNNCCNKCLDLFKGTFKRYKKHAEEEEKEETNNNNNT